VREHANRSPHRLSRVRADFIRLWITVTGLWSVATGLRIYNLWLPAWGWSDVLANPLTWTALTLPPLIFALVLASIDRVARSDRRSRSAD
jgi:hypothetical protein